MTHRLQTTALLIALLTLSFNPFLEVATAAPLPPAFPIPPTSYAAPLEPALKEAPKPDAPIGVVIPSIALNTTVVSVGINTKGEMDVPEGSTKDIGWYRGGPIPGQLGSAVFAAHVFAAFENLGKVKVGDEVRVTSKNGVVQKFIVEEVTTYKLSDLSPEHLFERADARRLNLITCAGELTPDGSTYTHRTVVYAVLAE